MNIDEVYPSKYLRGSDLAGRAATVTIDTVMLETFYDSDTRENVKKPVVYFEGKKKGLVLGRGLAHQVAEMLGPDTDA